MRNTMMRAFSAAGALALTAVLTACTGGASEPAPATTPVASETTAETWQPIAFEGKGIATFPLTMPSGARSLAVTVECDEPYAFSLSVGGDFDDDRGGACGGGEPVLLPLRNQTQMLDVTISDDAAYSISGEFSAEAVEIDVDDDIAAQCTAFSVAESIMYTATQRHYQGTLDAAEWTEVLREAAAAVAAVPTAGSEQITELLPVVQGTYETVAVDGTGYPELGASDGYLPALSAISGVCGTNGSPVVSTQLPG